MRQLIALSSLEAFEEFVLNNFDKMIYDDSYFAVSKASLKINTSEIKLESELKDTGSLLFLFKQNFPATKISYIENNISNKNDLINCIDNNQIDMLLVNTEEDVEEIDELTGVCLICVNKNSLPEITCLDYYKSFLKSKNYEISMKGGIKIDGWSYIFQSINLYPANSIIIQDNYLFHNNPDTFLLNTFKLVEKFLSPKLKVNFELIVLTLNPSYKERDWFENYKIQLERQVKRKINEKFTCCFVVHSRKDIHHKRILISNHTLSVSDNGFNAFNVAKPHVDNDILLKGIFAGLQKDGEIPLITINTWLKKIKKTIEEIKAQAIAGIHDNKKMIIGNPSNRLLNKIK